MQTVRVCDGLEVTNVDKGYLRELHETSNTIETGADAILEGLWDYIDNLESRYEEEPTVPYKKLYYALKQIVKSANENEEVRDAVLVGIINKTGEIKPEVKPIKEQVVVVKEQVVVVKEQKSRNKSAITKFAKTHTAREVMEHFGFQTINCAKSYLYNHKISYVRCSAGKTFQSNLSVDKVKMLASNMRLCELYKTFGVTKRQMEHFCKKNQIVYKGAKK